MDKIFWCKNCLNMSTRPRITFDIRGFCNACQWMEEKKKLNWSQRINELKDIIKKNKNNKSNYDCLVPVSGGKDGAYVAHKLKEEYGLNILVTSRPPLGSVVGKNLNKFVGKDFDHIHITTNSKSMQTLNKLDFYKGSVLWMVSFNI